MKGGDLTETETHLNICDTVEGGFNNECCDLLVECQMFVSS